MKYVTLLVLPHYSKFGIVSPAKTTIVIVAAILFFIGMYCEYSAMNSAMKNGRKTEEQIRQVKQRQIMGIVIMCISIAFGLASFWI